MTATLHQAARGGGRATLAGLVGVLGSIAASAPADAGEVDTSRSAVRVSVASSTTISLRHERLPRGRKIVRYTVRPGDTATGLAVRYHAWTDELIAYNHLGSRAALYVGQRIAIPVVLSAVRHQRHRDHGHRVNRHHAHRLHAHRHHGHGHHGHHGHRHRGHHASQHPGHTSRHDPSRAVVRRTIIHTARRLHVDPQLALAVSWQEAGWQMHHVSSAGAIGAMQVLPTTGTWMSLYAGRPLHLHRTYDNVLAGVLLLRVLDNMTSTRARQIGAYYQGIGSVHEHGLQPGTRHYVANVLAIKRSLEHGWNPAR